MADYVDVTDNLLRLAERTTHRQTRELLTALAEQRWKRVVGGRGILLSHPLSGIDVPTPEYMRGSEAWPFDTYSPLRQLSVFFGGPRGDRLVFKMSRTGPPWVRTSERVLTYKAATEFVREVWDP